MSRADFLGQGGTPFDGFLYAEVGEDRSGNTVSVLSALARLGLDPWDEAEKLADLPREEARARLGGRFARFGDVPSLRGEEGAIIPRLLDLLPGSVGRPTSQGVVLPKGVATLGFGPILAIILVILFLVQTLIVGSGGSGN